MKLSTLILAFLMSAALVRAQDAPAAPQAATQSAEYPVRIQFDVGMTNGSMTSLTATEFFKTDLTVGGVIVAHPPSNPEVRVLDLIGTGSRTVNVLGKTFTYTQVWTALQAVLAQERAAQVATPTPTPTGP